MESKSQDKPYAVHVCTSCRPRGTARGLEEERAGYKLYKALEAKVNESELVDVIDVRPAECLSICPRPCGIAMSSPNSWVYLFGDQEPTDSVEEILECLSLYVETSDGYMSRLQRPKGMRGSILGRIPPRGVPNASL